MALIFKHCRYMHVPRTGGKWLEGAAFNAGLRSALWWPKHSTLDETGGIGLFTFSFVREPLSWYRSYFAYKLTIGEWGAKHDPWTEFDEKVRAPRFSKFLGRAVKNFPGFYSKLLRGYVGEPGQEIDFIGRFENLLGDTLRAFDTAGETFDKHALLDTKRTNSAKYKSLDMRCSPTLIQDMQAAEAEAYERFYPEKL